MRYVLAAVVFTAVALFAIKHRWRTCPKCGLEFDSVAAVARHLKHSHIDN